MYKRQDKYFPVSIKNTAVMSFIGMPIGLVVALALAVLLSKEVKGMPAFRTCLLYTSRCV